MKYKKGQYAADTWIWYLGFGIGLTIVFLFFVFIMSTYASKSVEIPGDVDEYLFVKRFTDSNQCFAFEQAGKTYPGIIDWEKFSNERIESCYNVNPDSKGHGFKLTLEIPGEEPKTIQTKNFNVRAGVMEKGEKKIPVYYNNEYLEGTLSIEVFNV